MTRIEKNILLIALLLACGYILISDPLDLVSHLPHLVGDLRKLFTSQRA
jgi:hypothetical protein